MVYYYLVWLNIVSYCLELFMGMSYYCLSFSVMSYRFILINIFVLQFNIISYYLWFGWFSQCFVLRMAAYDLLLFNNIWYSLKLMFFYYCILCSIMFYYLILFDICWSYLLLVGIVQYHLHGCTSFRIISYNYILYSSNMFVCKLLYSFSKDICITA